MMILLMVCVVGYLFGCLHGAQLIGKYKKIDIKKSDVKIPKLLNTTIL